MPDHSSDCYLCGAQNSANASFCVRCNGQLLRLPTVDAEPEAPGPSESDEESEVAKAAEPSAGSDQFRRLRQLRRKSTLDDSRLSDALGLNDSESPDMVLPPTTVNAVPKASQAKDIPIIGTIAGAVPQKTLRSEPSRRV